MFSRLKLSVTWVPINNSSSHISLFLFNLYLQWSIIDVLEFLYLCSASGYCTTKQHNKEKEKVTSHLPPIWTNTSFYPRTPSQTACSKGSTPKTAPTHTPTPMPPLKAGEYNSRNASDRIRNASEKNPRREWDPDSVRRAVKNYTQHLRGVLIRIWHFPLTIEAYLPNVWPVFFFSHILLQNLVRSRMGPATNSFLIFFQECAVLVTPQSTDDLVLYCLTCTFSVPPFEENLPRKHLNPQKWDPQVIEPENSEEHGEIWEPDGWL